MKAFNLIFSLFFLAGAALQFNDPDPYIWIPLYVFAALLCILPMRKKYFPDAYLIAMGIYILYAAFLFFEEHGVLDWINRHDAESITETMKATKPWIEDTREFFALLIMAAVMIVNYYYVRRMLRAKARIFE